LCLQSHSVWDERFSPYAYFLFALDEFREALKFCQRPAIPACLLKRDFNFNDQNMTARFNFDFFLSHMITIIADCFFNSKFGSSGQI
jgi:hypothetical protein